MNSGLQRLKKITKNRVESILLLKAALNKDTFLEYILTYFDEEALLNEINFSNFNEKLSENEFQQLHYLYHYPLLWNVLKEQKFSTIDASNPIKWLSITFQAIKNDNIKPYYLAFVDNDRDGKNNIYEALRLSEQGNDKKLFNICRAILRHTFGSIQERGRKGIYQDIPFSIAWWKIFLSKEIANNIQKKDSDVVQYLLLNKSAYNDLIEKMGFTLTIMADKNIRDGLFLYVLSNDNNGTSKFKYLSKIIGIESAWRGMGILNPAENQKIIESLVE